MARPIVAIVGRPNVGKSTLFNRLIGERRAIVEDEPGTTRDRVYGTTDWGGVEFTLVDTGGLQDDREVETGSLTQIAHHTREQAHAAIGEADVIVFMVDAEAGSTRATTKSPTCCGAPTSRRSSWRTRPTAWPGATRRSSSTNWVSAIRSPFRRTTAVAPATCSIGSWRRCPRPSTKKRPRDPRSRSWGGQTSARAACSTRCWAKSGRSSATSRERPATQLDTVFVWAGQPITLIDTAGIRRRGRIDRGIEQYSVLRSMRAIDRADVVLLVIDATEGFTAQDLHIAGYIEEQKKGIVVVVNKWDLIEKDSSTMEEYRDQARAALDFMPYAPLVFISAKFGQRVQQVMDTALAVVSERHKRVPTAALNKMLKEAVAAHPPPSKPGKWLKFYYATQADVSPPTFIFF